MTDDPRIAAVPDIHGHAKGEHKLYVDERPIPYTARMLFLWFFHACRRGAPRFLMVADHINYLTFEDPAAVNLVRRALKLAQAGDLYGAAETAGVEVAHASVVGDGLRRGMRYSIGAEVDNDPRSRPDAQNIVDAMRPDGIVRSVHFLPIAHPQFGENWMWPFDNPEFSDLYDVVGTDQTWEIYMATLLDAIEKLPGHIVGHFYVPGKFGHWPADDVLETYEDRLLEACAERGMAIEINARTFYKYSVSDEAQLEKYRALNLRLLRKAKERGVAVAVGSDAHSPKDQGRGFAEVLALLDEAEINEIAFPIDGRIARVALRATEELRQAGTRNGSAKDSAEIAIPGTEPSASVEEVAAEPAPAAEVTTAAVASPAVAAPPKKRPSRAKKAVTPIDAREALADVEGGVAVLETAPQDVVTAAEEAPAEPAVAAEEASREPVAPGDEALPEPVAAVSEAAPEPPAAAEDVTLEPAAAAEAASPEPVAAVSEAAPEPLATAEETAPPDPAEALGAATTSDASPDGSPAEAGNAVEATSETETAADATADSAEAAPESNDAPADAPAPAQALAAVAAVASAAVTAAVRSIKKKRDPLEATPSEPPASVRAEPSKRARAAKPIPTSKAALGANAPVIKSAAPAKAVVASKAATTSKSGAASKAAAAPKSASPKTTAKATKPPARSTAASKASPVAKPSSATTKKRVVAKPVAKKAAPARAGTPAKKAVAKKTAPARRPASKAVSKTASRTSVKKTSAKKTAKKKTKQRR